MKNKKFALIVVLIFLSSISIVFTSKLFAQVSIKDKGSVKKILIDKIRITKDSSFFHSILWYYETSLQG